MMSYSSEIEIPPMLNNTIKTGVPSTWILKYTYTAMSFIIENKFNLRKDMSNK
jgi:hypothetical protein